MASRLGGFLRRLIGGGEDAGTAAPVGPAVEDASPAGFPGGGPWVGRTVTLRQVQPDNDAEALFDVSHGTSDKLDIWTYMPSCGPFADVNVCRDWLTAVCATEDARFLAVVDNASGRAVGMAAFLAVKPEMRCVELGFIWYTPALQRTTANTEVIRMMHTLLGEDGFQEGMRLYFERHDGAAVTCDDFVAAMADANGADLAQFKLWYS